MPTTSLIDELPRYGPTSSAAAPSLAEARAYCRRLTATHYENFSVAGWLCPRELRQHFCNVYAYCRWADDLADETNDPRRSLELLHWWGDELRACYAGDVRHPVFVALADTIREFALPPEPLTDLLSAFEQDQTTTAYETFAELQDYCRRSADPVGRLVLYLGRACDDDLATLSDAICTGLQLANFWQDVRRDRAKGRVYLPRESLRRFDVDESQLDAPAASPEFKRLLRFEVDRAETFLRTGLPLAARLPRNLAGSIWLFAHGGLTILDKIRRLDYDVLRTRPVVSKFDQARLLVGYLGRRFAVRRGADR